jgi:hypothetical protein
MKKRLLALTISLLTLAVLAPPASAASCRDAVLERVAAARVGNPKKPIPRLIRPRATTAIVDSINAGESREAAYQRFIRLLSRVNNDHYRRQLANAAADVVANPPNACKR